MVPKELTEEQKQRRVTTGDETWVYQYDLETKRQGAQWKIANSSHSKSSASPNQESKYRC
jgi:hypothetical protein